MLTNEFVVNFAREWIDAWNAHNLERILAYYADDFEMSSPIITKIAGEPSGRLKGKKAVGRYWQKALNLFPDLRFDMITVLAGVDTTIIYYKGHRGLASRLLIKKQD